MIKKSDWEARCRRCGRCCYEKIDYNGRIHYTDEPCEMLDPKTLLCTVYDNRHLQRPGCKALTPEVLQRGIMPADCPYVTDIEDYPPPLLFGESEDDE